MRINLFILLLNLLSLSSCTTTYFYSIMNSEDPYTFKNQVGEFVSEDDSIEVFYSFHGENAPINIGIYNRMSIPVYIDWRRSGVIIDGQTTMFREPIKQYAERSDTTSANFERFLNDPDGIGFVKPNSLFNAQVLELANFKFHKIPSEQFQKSRTEKGYKGDFANLKSIVYDNENSPIYIEIFLTIYDKADNMSNPWLFESSFYMSELIKAGKTPPSGLQSFQENRGDIFYIRREKNTFWRKAGKVLGEAAVVTGNIIIWALEEGNEY